MLDRREFLRVLSMMGLSSLLSSSCSARSASPAATLDEGQITVEMVAAAEKMFGIELTDEEREEVLERLPELVEDGPDLLLSLLSTGIVIQLSSLTLAIIEQSNVTQRLFGNGTLVGDVQIMELVMRPPCLGENISGTDAGVSIGHVVV